MGRYLHKAAEITKNQGNVTALKEYGKPLVPSPKEMEFQESLNKVFMIIVLQMLRKLQETTEKKFYDIRKTICEQNEMFNKEKENI